MDEQQTFDVAIAVPKTIKLSVGQGRDYINTVTETEVNTVLKFVLTAYQDKFDNDMGKQVTDSHSVGNKQHIVLSYNFKVPSKQNIWVLLIECRNCKAVRTKSIQYLPSFRSPEPQVCYQKDFVIAGERA